MADNVKVIPTSKSLGKSALTGLKAGGIGGITVGLGARLLGPILGSVLGSVLAGAMLPGVQGQIVVTNGVMDGIVALFLAPPNSGTNDVM